ncbi:MAG: hypothetical protein ACTSWN_00370 [Promethearchaeota archaeon]
MTQENIETDDGVIRKKFDEGLEEANSLARRQDIKGAIMLYSELLEIAEDMGWEDEIDIISDRILELREMQIGGNIVLEKYLEKRQEMEKNENYFITQIEKASNFEGKNDYGSAVKIYNDLIEFCERLGWNEQVKSLKELIAATRDKEKKYLAELEKRKQIAEQKKREGTLRGEAIKIMDQAKEFFENEDYQKARELYQEALSYFKMLNNSSYEINIITDSINACEEKIKEIARKEQLKKENELKLKEIFKQKEWELEQEKKILEEQMEKAQRKMLEEQRQKIYDEIILERAGEYLDKANDRFRAAKMKRFINEDDIESEFSEIIKNYEKARNIFEKAGWTEQVSNIDNAIKLLEKERSNKLTLLALELDHKQKMTELEKSYRVPTKLKQADKAKELLDQACKIKAKKEMAFSVLEKAGKKLHEFQRKGKIINQDIFRDNEYPEIIKLYEKARELFKEIGWLDEAKKINDSIKIIKREEELFLKEKETFERKVRERKKQELKEQEELKQLEELRRQEAIERENYIKQQKEAEKRNMELLQEEINKILKEALMYYKQRNYAKAEECYKKAYNWYMDHDWSIEAKSIQTTLEMVREKRIEFERHKARLHEKQMKDDVEFSKDLSRLAQQAQETRLQEEQASIEKKSQAFDENAKKERMEKELFRILKRATDLMNEKQYQEAIESFKEGLKIAEKLEWVSQVKNIKDSINEARKLNEKEELEEKRRREERIKAEGYELIDKAKDLLTKNEAEKAISRYKEAIEKFKQLNMNREIEIIQNNISKIKSELKARREEKLKEMESQKKEQITKKAFDLLDEAKKEHEKRKVFRATKLAKQALSILQSMGDEWSRELEQVKAFVAKLEKEKAERRKIIEKIKTGTI